MGELRHVATTPIDWKEVFSYAEVIAKYTNSSAYPVIVQAIVEAVNFQLSVLRQDLMNLKDEITKVASGEKSDERFHQLAERVENYAKHVFESQPVANVRVHGATARRCYCGSPIRDGDFDCWTCPVCTHITVLR